MTNKIGIIGGSGLYSLSENATEKEVDTPYGKPSDKLTMATYKGKELVFLPRHGKGHTQPPHTINYRANMWALKQEGVKFILSSTAAGSLQKNIKPGEFVIVDQYVDRTWGRKDTIFDGPKTVHIGSAEPYCQDIRKLAINAAKKLGFVHHPKGTVVIIQGPRFSTRSESKWFTGQGWEVINMTQYPEVALARELEMCYCNISLITDYDAGFEGELPPVTTEEVVKVFKNGIGQMRAMIFDVIENLEIGHTCECHSALQRAVMA